MVEKGRAYVNARSGGRLMVIEHWDDTNDRRARIERTMPPGTGRGEPHLHLDFTQTWEGVQGEATIMVDGEERPLRAGDQVEI
jgi:mannose-6-phosphate isomerase-like protein (cupin superfamily)